MFAFKRKVNCFIILIRFARISQGVRPIAFDEKTGQFGNEFELYSLKTGQLCYKHTILQSLIDVTKGGRAVHVNKLAETEEKWKNWKEWWNAEAAKAQKLVTEAEVRDFEWQSKCLLY